MLGAEDLSHGDMARIMSEMPGRPIRFQRTPDEDFRARLVGFGMSEPTAQSRLDMTRAEVAGLDNGVSRTPLSSSPTSFHRWCEGVLRPAVLA
ncbi:hypothetical protein [Streptosporangium saharense]|uniref:hypothetical protein n=1 Tax=Streptosporangium saharense TaxID=1706840 RepID=UPI003333ABA2